MKKAAIFSLVLGIGVAFAFWWLRPRTTASETTPSLAAETPTEAPRKTAPLLPAAPPGTATPIAADPKIVVLREILASRNDGDRRLDTDFNQLTPETKENIRAVYRTLAPEKFNEKGTIVFLLGRNLVNEVDFDFVDEVLAEPACRSLSDCNRAPAATTGEEAHTEGGSEITLAYPQIVAIKALERMKEDSATPDGLKTEIQKRLETARRSNVPVVARTAEAALVKTAGS